MKKYFVVFGFLGVIMLCFVIYQMVFVSDKLFHLVVCDVGQGDGMYIRTPGGRDIVVDGGPDNKILGCLSRHMPFWDHDIDIVFLTHGHSDHAVGIMEVLQRYNVANFVTQEDLGEGDVVRELQRVMSEKNIHARYATRGDKVRMGDVEFSVLWPSDEFLERTDDSNSGFDENVTSLTFMMEYGETNILLTGDVGENVLREILSKYDVDVLKLPHHGSDTGVNDGTFDVQRVEVGLISVGENSYGHPDKSVTSELEEKNIPYLRTDVYGDIEVISDGEKFWVEK